MNKIEELKNILIDGVLPELNSEIDALEKLINKKNSKDLIEELNYLKDVKRFYDEALRLINENKLSVQEAQNILLDLEDMEEDEGDL
ncbi:hypothetical protein CRU86_07580 [Aliarcobacter skirrowii]|uniref:Uncharacterized protein n=2 Tax=Aliarcobacter skirrowii TaxID=28200 RepID=A0AAD0SLS2_9BACT|nr:hypothetical protein [Aliarcobacter skirrowii]AXX85132.1 hypothetical protein ASKIR_1329 [Aliarcobacter skirrowii CCUG 10374]AZL54180.1 hypothetical protein EI285_06125 [Aliarcobacter skirrowii]KAB0620710.1 hypothetical protein F7P70_06120 [Aliarcobacter skirrowii CCUG 10374]MDD2508509.1 hypothetical protein [Aliarcobacter skirrowii]MDD3497286.1 hypothetical protein [Aliarcobacter skirrowii]